MNSIETSNIDAVRRYHAYCNSDDLEELLARPAPDEAPAKNQSGKS